MHVRGDEESSRESRVRRKVTSDSLTPRPPHSRLTLETRDSSSRVVETRGGRREEGVVVHHYATVATVVGCRFLVLAIVYFEF